MTKASDNLFPGIILRESADDGSDFSNPAADYRRLFLGEDGDLHLKDSAGSVTDIGGGGGGGGMETLLFDPFITSEHDAGWNTYVAVLSAASCRLPYLQSSGSQNSEVVFDSRTFAGGTYTVEIVVFKASNHGIVHLQVDGSDLTTFDLYNGSSLPDQQMVATGLSVSAGAHAISMQMSTKNGSSSNYYGLVNRLIFRQTA